MGVGLNYIICGGSSSLSCGHPYCFSILLKHLDLRLIKVYIDVLSPGAYYHMLSFANFTHKVNVINTTREAR